MDSAGNAYVTGHTSSTEATFPVTVGPDLTFNGGVDAFVAKVNAAGTALVYAGYIGGTGDRAAAVGIAVDSAGNAYVTGLTIPRGHLPGDRGARTSPSTAAARRLRGQGQRRWARPSIYAGYIGGDSSGQ